MITFSILLVTNYFFISLFIFCVRMLVDLFIYTKKYNTLIR